MEGTGRGRNTRSAGVLLNCNHCLLVVPGEGRNCTRWVEGEEGADNESRDF